MKKSIIVAFILYFTLGVNAQNYTFDFNSSGRRVCLVSSEVNLNDEEVKLIFHDSLSNNSEALFVSRRQLGDSIWTSVASDITAGTGHWIDNNVALGDLWEYQVKRQNTWGFDGQIFDAVGYTIGSLAYDNTEYKGQMILLVSEDIPFNISDKYMRLKKEITADGWYINELVVPRATSWDSGAEVVDIKNQITIIYENAPTQDKPKTLFILGHVPLPRCGSTDVVAPDEHNENKGARGCDAYYADIDGVFTDIASYNPGGLATSLAVNIPGDYKWDQDFIPSDLEMAFGRIDFADILELQASELTLIENYLDRLSNYRNVSAGADMGDKSAFYYGYDNSNDGTYRSLVNISKSNAVYQNYAGPNHNQWVRDNGPFKIYMQNLLVPSMDDWENHGMDATVFSSDQSYWGFGDVPQSGGIYSRIRALLGVDSKCLVTLWTTTGINIFHQSCTGLPIGQAMKEIMNHNSSNQYLEKPPQAYDTESWWNRTHFAFYGDPTLTLYQIAPPRDPSIVISQEGVLVEWTASDDAEVIGYHVYESNEELGTYLRISDSVVLSDRYVIPNYQEGKWYMVKAVKLLESGCGKFMHASMGTSIESIFIVDVSDLAIDTTVILAPNPASSSFLIQSPKTIASVEVFTAQGTALLQNENINDVKFSIDCNNWVDGIYLVQVETVEGGKQMIKLVKND